MNEKTINEHMLVKAQDDSGVDRVGYLVMPLGLLRYYRDHFHPY